MKKFNFSWRKVNACFWFVLAVILMWVAHDAWSQYGPYTFGSFLCSLVIHGGGCFFFFYLVDERLSGGE